MYSLGRYCRCLSLPFCCSSALLGALNSTGTDQDVCRGSYGVEPAGPRYIRLLPAHSFLTS